MSSVTNIRNFCIIAHIDHGKTTLSDRLIELTHRVEKRVMKDQLLDSMDLERERGITIKSHPVTLSYCDSKGDVYILNLIDTPGHVDFSYEVSRSLTACEGALLLVDAAQGIEAQTVANAHLAVEQRLVVIPVINKIDLPGADIESTRHQLEEILAIPAEETLLASAKNGIGIEEILECVVQRVPQPRWADYKETRGLIFDCVYDTFRGVICYVRIFSGSLKRGDHVLLMSDNVRAEVKEVGLFTPKMQVTDSLQNGSVGYVVTSLKNISDIKLGDTITQAQEPASEMLPGYHEARPMVFSGIYPLDTTSYEKLKASVAKLRLNDSAFVYQPETSAALGFGFRCGFLGLLHMEIIMERIRREYDLDIISTYPSVVYKVNLTDGGRVEIDNPAHLPEITEIESIEEPFIKANLHIPTSSVGDILGLVLDKRGTCEHTESVDETRLILQCFLPLNEILVDFNDRLKSITRGYGSMDYDFADYRVADLVRLDILVNGENVDAFSSITNRQKSVGKGRILCQKLKEILPRQLYKVAIQAAVGGTVIARETIGSLRKDVTAKCYGGDITRKKKLLERQKEGKKRMKQIGKISIPQEAFINILKTT